MLGALAANPALQPLLPYARQFYAEPSSYTWYDDAGVAHEVLQAEGGEQGDPLMPALYSPAQHPALAGTQALLSEGETVFAFLDNIDVVAAPERIRPILTALQAALWEHARIQLHAGKTRIWNAAGEEPPNISDLECDPQDPVWVGGIGPSPPTSKG